VFARHTLSHPAFTLIEVLVAVSMLTLLIAILLPALANARRSARTALCLSNLRQMTVAAQAYTHTYQERYPIAQYMVRKDHLRFHYKWDFTTVADSTTRQYHTRPGLLWGRSGADQIQQCPEFAGGSNAPGGTTSATGQPTEKYTGYNYNTSYLGHGQNENPREAPAKVSEVARPAECAIFGDGEYSSGANKFMRAPWDDPDNSGDNFEGRSAGTQGYRHQGKTNVSFCDGHAVVWAERHTDTYAGEQRNIAPGTGFLSRTNRYYSLGRYPTFTAPE
jgi:prepilin-type processing-associated H-X9-DG protein